MKIKSYLRKHAGTTFALLALVAAQVASTRVSIIFYQDEIPEKVKALKK